ncbi:hypothetical protein CWS02_04615 [Enterobacter sp. EA-1]|nr:hypothetical protein CWS02_04615 [Enterobacter sp. EA-1]
MAFLLWYGFGALKTALSSQPDMASADALRRGALAHCCHHAGGDWLNPHVYLDTFVVLGSTLGGQLDVEPRRWFALGTVSASFLWFFSLALLAAPRLRTAKAQRMINLLVGLVMWFIALQLAKEGVHHLQGLFS